MSELCTLRPTTLGRTGLTVGRLGISSSFGAPAAAFEEAFERGCNDFTWGTFIRGRSGAMRTAIRNLVTAGKRDSLAVPISPVAAAPAWSPSQPRTGKSSSNPKKCRPAKFR